MIIDQYDFTEVFAVFSDGLSKSMMAAMSDGITSTGGLLLYVLDRLFDSFSDESLSDVDDQNSDDVGELYTYSAVFSYCKKVEIMVAVLDCWLL